MQNSEDQKAASRSTGHWGELPSLSRRIARYQTRIEAGHPLLGQQPGGGAIKLSGNDYLCLAGHSAIIEAQVAIMHGGGDDVYMSAAFLTDGTKQRAVERKMAAFLGTEDAVLCQSGLCANVGMMQAVTDQDTQVYLDSRVHAGFWDGARSTGALIRPFRHNNPESLENEIRKYGAGVITVSAVYGADGSICPLAEIAGIAERHGCEIIVDETHSIGIYGRQGQGLVSDLGLREKVTYRTFSLSKAMVTRAGMVTGPARIMDFFRFEARPAIFSSAVLPHEVAGLGAALNVIQEEDWRRERLRHNSDSLRRRLALLGFDVPLEGSQIIPLLAGHEDAAIVLRDALEANDLFGTLVCAPATTRNGALVRLSINSGLIEDDLRRIVRACARVREEIPASRWPIALRQGVSAVAGENSSTAAAKALAQAAASIDGHGMQSPRPAKEQRRAS